MGSREHPWASVAGFLPPFRVSGSTDENMVWEIRQGPGRGPSLWLALLDPCAGHTLSEKVTGNFQVRKACLRLPSEEEQQTGGDRCRGQALEEMDTDEPAAKGEGLC